MYTEKKTIFIDGSSGTAGLRIYDRLAQRADITLLTLCCLSELGEQRG